MSAIIEKDISVHDLSREEITERFKKILISNGIKDDISEVKMKDAGLKGEGFASQTHLVTVNFKNDSRQPLNLFVKTETTNESHSEFLRDTKFFEKESVFFMEYVPAAEEFLRPLGEERLLNMYPKCYYGDLRMIVLENLVLNRGFEVIDKAEQHDLTAARLALTSLAKHHAISYAMMQKMGGPKQFFEKFPVFEFEPSSNPAIRTMMEPSVTNGIQTNIELLQKSTAEDKEEAIEFMKANAGNAWNYLTDAMRMHPEDDMLLVLNHGDFWSCNGGFIRDKDTNELVDHIVIDLQTVRYDSPGTDLGYYMFSSVKPDVRRNNLQELLKHYLYILNGICERLGYPTSLDYERLYLDFRRKFEFGFWFSGILTTKAAFLAMNDIDITSLDMNQFGAEFSKILNNWIENNPEITEEDAKTLVNIVKEYKRLTLH